MNKPKKVDPHEPDYESDWDAYREKQAILEYEEQMAMMDAEEEEDYGNEER